MYQFKFLYKLIYRIHIFMEADRFSMGRQINGDTMIISWNILRMQQISLLDTKIIKFQLTFMIDIHPSLFEEIPWTKTIVGFPRFLEPFSV